MEAMCTHNYNKPQNDHANDDFGTFPSLEAVEAQMLATPALFYINSSFLLGSVVSFVVVRTHQALFFLVVDIVVAFLIEGMEDSDDDLSDSSGFLNPGPVVPRPSPTAGGGGAAHRGIAHQPTIPKSFPSSFLLPVGHHVDDAAIGTTTSRFASGQVNNPPSAATNQKQKRSGNTLVAGNKKKAPTSNESRMLSQSSNNPVPTTTGIRSRGINYTQQELMDLLDRIDEYLPVLQTEWELVATAHKQNYPNRECDYKNLRRKFFDVKKMKKTLPNGDPCIPYEVLRAKEIYQKIKARGQIENLDEDDGECAVGAAADDNKGIGNMDNNHCTEAGTAIVEATTAADPRSTMIGSSVARIGARPDRKKKIDHGQVNNFRELQQWMMWKDEENKREERRFRYEEERRREEERKEDRRREERRRDDDRRRQDEDRKMMMQLAFMAMGAFMSRSGGTGGIASMDNLGGNGGGGPISSTFGSYETLRSNHNNNNNNDNDDDDNSEDNEKEHTPKDKKH